MNFETLAKHALKNISLLSIIISKALKTTNQATNPGI